MALRGIWSFDDMGTADLITQFSYVSGSAVDPTGPA